METTGNQVPEVINSGSAEVGPGADDHERFARLFQDCRPCLQNLCQRILGESDRASDAVSETYLRACRNWANFDGVNLAGWMSCIAKHICNDRMPLGSDQDERAFSSLLRPGIRELQERRGPCPSSEDLVAFRDSRLPVEEAARVRDHVEACGLCDAQLGRLEAADRPLWRSGWALVQKPAFAYGLVALLLFPAYRGLIQPVGNVGIAPVPSFSLDVVRSDSQSQKSPFVRLADNERFFLLSFFIPF